MTKKNLEKFLKELAQNPKLMDRYKANPRQIMTEHGVDPEHQEFIMNGDDAAVQKALGGTDKCMTTTIRNFKD